MKVLHLAWEFPPNKVGGLAEHVYSLSRAYAEKYGEAYVLTPGYGEFKEQEEINGIKVYRFEATNIPAEDFPSWVSQINTLFVNAAIDIIKEEEIDIIHAHDWIVANAGIILKHLFRKPLIATIHATEHGRRGGIYDDRQQFIHFLEERLAFEAWKVIACSYAMRDEISHVLHVPYEKIEVIPNGVFEAKIGKASESIRKKYALPHEKIILFVGRHVYEKGLDVLIKAFAELLKQRDDVKLVILGKGYYTDEAKNLVYSLGIAHKVVFGGFVSDEERDALYELAEIVAIPSRYEPFGIVALEGMKYGKVVVASDVGGLREVVKHEYNGLTFFNENHHSLKDQILRALNDRELSNKLRTNALKSVKEEFNWYAIAKKTAQLYNNVLEEYEKVNWKPRSSIYES
ncbi:MAG: glycosyltransferase family 4 protein [Candidatus Nanohaloarchaeota archaeon]|nr:glycosyltransferase family 4 protein [Candidatus Nanohaloarchaeota archaeon]